MKTEFYDTYDSALNRLNVLRGDGLSANLHKIDNCTWRINWWDNRFK